MALWPPPPALGRTGVGQAMSFHTPDETISLAESRVMLVPPTEVIHVWVDGIPGVGTRASAGKGGSGTRLPQASEPSSPAEDT